MLFGFAVFFLISCKNSNFEEVENRNEAGKIIEKYTRNKKDFSKEGICQRFSDDGKLAEEANFKNGVTEGDRKFFFPNGTVEIIEPNVAGKIHGKYKKFAENGTLVLEQDYQNGVLEGISKAFYENGTLKEEVSMKNNEENGPFKEWHENGKLKAEGNYLTPDDPDFEGEKEDGELKMYDENGVLERIMDCNLGVCKTTWQREK